VSEQDRHDGRAGEVELSEHFGEALGAAGEAM
jgi:hypothetical protein